MSLLILSAGDVNTIANDVSPKELITLMSNVFRDLSQSSNDLKTQSPHRASIETSNHTTLIMPSHWTSAGTAVKIVSVPKKNAEAGLPATTVLVNEESGATEAVINARSLTAIRTAAGSALATSLVRGISWTPRNLVLFGAGLQVAYHATLFLHPDVHGNMINTVTIINRSKNERLNSLVQDLQRRFPDKQIRGLASSSTTDMAAFEGVVREADLICAATSSREPLFPSHWVKAGAHINLVGSYTPEMREVDAALVKRADAILVDSREACRKEAGDLIQAGWDDALNSQIHEIGECVGRDVVKGGITIFKSVGVGVQDVAIASLVAKRAREKGIGTTMAYE